MAIEREVLCMWLRNKEASVKTLTCTYNVRAWIGARGACAPSPRSFQFNNYCKHQDLFCNAVVLQNWNKDSVRLAKYVHTRDGNGRAAMTSAQPRDQRTWRHVERTDRHNQGRSQNLFTGGGPSGSQEEAKPIVKIFRWI